MSKTHWKKLVNPNYLGAYSIEDGKDLIYRIKQVRMEDIVGENGRKESGMIAYFHDAPKPMILNRTNAKTIQKLTGSPYIEDWADHYVQLYATTTRFGGDTVECLRIRPFEPKVDQSRPVKCADCGSEITKYGKMTAAQVAEQTRLKYGKPLCAGCGQRAKAEAEKPDKLSAQIMERSEQDGQAGQEQEENNG